MSLTIIRLERFSRRLPIVHTLKSSPRENAKEREEPPVPFDQKKFEKHFNLPDIRTNSNGQCKQLVGLLQLNETNNSYKRKESKNLDLFSPGKYTLIVN